MAVSAFFVRFSPLFASQSSHLMSLLVKTDGPLLLFSFGEVSCLFAPATFYLMSLLSESDGRSVFFCFE